MLWIDMLVADRRRTAPHTSEHNLGVVYDKKQILLVGRSSYDLNTCIENIVIFPAASANPFYTHSIMSNIILSLHTLRYTDILLKYIQTLTTCTTNVSPNQMVYKSLEIYTYK